MSDSWVSVIYDESDPSDEAIEVQTEPDGTVLLSSIVQQFPGVTGLKFRNPDSTKKGFRMVRVVPNEHTSVLYPPSAEDGWGDVTYFCVKPKATKVCLCSWFYVSKLSSLIWPVFYLGFYDINDLFLGKKRSP